MKVLDWENLVNEKYTVKKITDIKNLKPYLTKETIYQHCFTVYDITEFEIDDANFHSAYVFDENEIAKRNVKFPGDSGWNTTVIFIESTDRENITNYFIHSSNGLIREEMDTFLTRIKIRELEKSFSNFQMF